MKKLIIAIAVLLVLGAGGLWLSMRRAPGGSLLPEQSGPFQVVASGPGQLIKLQDPQVPLRALRWVGPIPGGLLAAQMVTQSDRQQVVLFRNGQPAGQLMVAKPLGLSEGYWRFAVLKEMLELPGGDLALLYAPMDPASSEPNVLLAVDAAHADTRWTHRGPFQHMVLAAGKDPQLFLFGTSGPIQRLPVAAASGAEAGRSGPNAAARTIELPPEVAGIDDLLPTGGSGFLVSHGKGLSAFSGKAGWSHLPLPAEHGVACAGWRSCLVRAGRKLWWQPWPGTLVEVAADGRTRSEWAPEPLAEDDPFAPDISLLRLIGADQAGALWFALASPAPASQAPAAPAQPQPTPAQAQAIPAQAQAVPAQPHPTKAQAQTIPAQAQAIPAQPHPTPAQAQAIPAQPQATPAQTRPIPAPAGAGAEPVPPMDWAAYRDKGLGRIYRLESGSRSLKRFSWSQDWSSLTPPPELAQPPSNQPISPEAGALAMEGPRCSWLLPLKALPFH